VTIRLLPPLPRPAESHRQRTLAALIEAVPERGGRHLLRRLLPLLRSHAAPLRALDPPALLDLARAALALLATQRADFAVRDHRSDCGRRWLLVNGPDAPHTAATLQLQPAFRSGRCTLVSYLALTADRNELGLVDLDGSASGPREVLIVIQQDAGAEADIERALRLNLAVHRHAAALQSTLDAFPPGYLAEEPSLALAWLRQGRFEALAYRRWHGGAGWAEDTSVRLGLAVAGTNGYLLPEDWFTAPDWQRLLARDQPLTVFVSPWQSPVYRSEPLYYLGIRIQGSGTPVEHGWLGLWSPAAGPDPVVSRKLGTVLDGAARPRGSYDYERLSARLAVLPELPLLLTGHEQLHWIARSLLAALTRPHQLKLVLLASTGPRLLNLVALQARALHQPDQPAAMADWLCRRLQARLQQCRIRDNGDEWIGIHWCLELPADELLLDLGDLERQLNRLGRPWHQQVRRLLGRLADGATTGVLAERWHADPAPGYREATPPGLAVRDLLQLQRLAETGRDQVQLYRRRDGTVPERWSLRLYSGAERYLDRVLPHLENLALRVCDHGRFRFADTNQCFFLDTFTVHGAAGSLAEVLPQLREAVIKVLYGEIESDGLNRLLTVAGFNWRTVDLLRTYRNYALQLKPRYGQERFHAALLNHPQVARLLVEYFAARFDPRLGPADPSRREEELLGGLRPLLAERLAQVEDSLEDYILRELFNLIDATLRCNFYQRDGTEHFLAIKLDSLGLLQLPQPKPRYEIYVHGRHLEGIHLRSARVARGGIRWSERPDDFRAEILGLLRTQNVKNALIVPGGAKGGFVTKTADGARPTAEQVRAAYRSFIRALLALTDNREAAAVRPPAGTIVYDGDDPYLVVAADKGTAKLSDTANELAAEHGFWLGDAFASGGSRGYDHKALGITARGAWECVRRHFGELGQDADGDALTVIGIGSMDGDVFGNGLLLSRNLRLVAAFDGRHIFLDPNPDAVAAWSERRRLFELPGSSWADYDRARLSAGGGVFRRDARDIPLAGPVRAWLGTHQTALDGDVLIRMLLAAPADLMWLGGIGTYVKASGETHEAIGDRANDTVRVDAADLRVRVVAEGANLGFTQLARVEYARSGGRINTDAVDNSAGVDLSDHEVNLKILLDQRVRSGRMAGGGERDRRLAELAPEVCAMVLAHNASQSLAISLDLLRCEERPEPFLEVIDRLENAGQFERTAEGLPHRREVAARPPPPLTRPELAVLLLHSKLALKRALLEQPAVLHTAPAQRRFLEYFPPSLRDSATDDLGHHPLAQSIAATVVVNHIVDRAGAGFLAWPGDLSAATLAAAAARYLRWDARLEPAPAAPDICYRALLEREQRIRSGWQQGDP